MTKLRERSENNYLLIRQKASDVVRNLFNEYQQFNPKQLVTKDELGSKYLNSPYRFRYVAQKYFMNVTFNFHSLPFKYALPVFDFYLRKKFSQSYKIIIGTYKNDFIRRCQNVRSLFPNLIETEEDISQIIKLIMACTLTTYITYPIYVSRKAQLEKSYLSGFYLGIAYLIGDKHLDNSENSHAEKFLLHNDILNFLSDPLHHQTKHALIHTFAQEVTQHFDPDIYQTQYNLLFYLQKIQYEDQQFKLDDTSMESIIQKTINSGLKTFLSLHAVQSCGKKFDMYRNFEINFLYSLLVQLDDDLRDIKKDREHNIRTLFSQPISHNNFSPHLLYLQLVGIFVQKNKQLSWLYADYFLHLKNKERFRGIDHNKIALFIEKTTPFKLSDIARSILT